MEPKVIELTRAQRIIFEAVHNIVKIAPEGERFFSLMDEFLKRAPQTVYDEALSAVTGKDEVVVLSGGFGKVIADRIDAGEITNLPYILFKGGIRTGNEPVLLRAKYTRGMGITKKAVFLDDTIYGGKTYYKIKEHLSKGRSGISLDRCFVIYDGCPVKKSDVGSLFRYYDFFKANPNFKF